MPTIKKIRKGDSVKLLSGKNKGMTGKVVQVLAGQNALLIEGIGTMHRTVKPSRQNPRGGKKEIHMPTPIHKVALVIDEKTAKTSRVGFSISNTGQKVRVARQNKNKEIK